jgi:hypothetical protein
VIHAAVWFFFLGGLALNMRLFGRMDLARLDFLDGILIGQAYYILIPLAVFLIAGQTEMPDVALTYRPYQDLATTGMLICGMFLFALLRLMFPRVHRDSRDTSDPRMITAIVVLFVGTGVVSFLLTGLAHGGHWQGNLEGAFANPLFLPIKYTANVTRNAVFAVLLYAVTTRRLTAPRAVLLGAAFVLMDLLTTFNRITAVYLLIMAMLLLKRRPWRMAAAGAISLCTLSAFSALWPAFRGLATTRGYTLASFAQAWTTARAGQGSASTTLDASLNGVFESSNIVVLNWIVEHYGTAERPFLAFAMFARPITLLLPASVWPGRPQNFGLALGDGIANLPSLALNSTLYGESYANFGWFWPLGLSAFVLLWHGVFRLIAPNARVVQIIGAFAAIAMWRFDASFVGCAALVTGAVVGGLWLLRISTARRTGPFYFVTSAGAVALAFMTLPLITLSLSIVPR